MNIQEIARLAGVSISTVSKVMNGKDKDISDRTRERVLRIVNENNYVPYAQYRAKEGLINRFVGLIIDKTNPYYSEIVFKVEERLQKADYHLVVLGVNNSNSLDELNEAIECLKKRGVLGIMINSQTVVPHVSEDLKIVYIAENDSDSAEGESYFYYSLQEAGEKAAEILFQNGHRSIGCLLLDKDKTILEGAENLFRKRGIPVEIQNSYVGKDLWGIREKGLRECINDKVSAVICGDKEIVSIVLEYARKTGRDVPKELSVLCTREHKILKYLAGGITAIEYPMQKILEDAVRHLLQMISERTKIEISRKFPLSVVERESVHNRSQKPEGKKILIVGCMNMDTMIAGVQIPVNGETHMANDIFITPGGKGANQAVGIGKLGGQAYMIGRIGKDADGRTLFKSLTDNNVDTTGVEFDERECTGKAFVHIDKTGENSIVVYRGANGNLDSQQLARHAMLFHSSSYCLLSSEISRETVALTVQYCFENDVKLILKPAAVDMIDEGLLEKVDYLVPNKEELNQLCDCKGTLEEKANMMLDAGVKNVIVTLGKDGAYLLNKSCSMFFSSAPFTPVDTTGGADAFISAMALKLSSGCDLIYSIIYATYAAGIAITRYGVQRAMPDSSTMSIYSDQIEKIYIDKMEGKD